MTLGQSKLRIPIRLILVLVTIFLGLFFFLSYAVRDHRISSVQMWAISLPIISVFIGLIVRQVCFPATIPSNLEGFLKTFLVSRGRSLKMIPWLVFICFVVAWLLLPFTPRLAMPIGTIAFLISRQLWIAKLERDEHGRWPLLQILSVIFIPIAFFLVVPYSLDFAISLVIGIYAFFLVVQEGARIKPVIK